MPDFENAEHAHGDAVAVRSEVTTRAEPTGSPNAAVSVQLARAPIGADPRGAQRRRLSSRQVIALQLAVGNRTVARVVRPIQRVAVADPHMTETLYNKETKGGKARASKYALDPKYEMTRSGDAVTVTVRIKFLGQSRNAVDPKSPGAPAGTPELGTLLDDPTEIPEGDERRKWAKETADAAVTIWNGHLSFVGSAFNPLTFRKAPERLKVTFMSQPVYGLNEQADNQVIIHPQSTVAGSPGQPIDAGNWYMNKGNYGGDDKVIAAHEYGHLIGIPDEYSQSNSQLNALLHQAAPATAASAHEALDRSTVELMTLASLRAPLVRRLKATLPKITKAFRAQEPLVKQKMTAAAQASIIAGDVLNILRGRLTLSTAAQMPARLVEGIAIETASKYNEVLQAGLGVDAGFSAAALGQQIQSTYASALWDAQEIGKVVAVQGLGEVSIDISSGVRKSGISGGRMGAAAGRLARSTVGLPKVAPDAALAGQIAALPATWSATGSLLETSITAAGFTEQMRSILESSDAAAGAPPPPGAVPPRPATEAEVFARAYRLISNAANGAATQLITNLVDASISPVVAASIADLQAKITAQVNRLMTTPPAGVAALEPADPNMKAVVAAMKARLAADEKATKGTGRDPLGAGVKAPNQDVTYSYQGLMGSSESKALRADQFKPIVDHFNKDLVTIFESRFKPEVK